VRVSPATASLRRKMGREKKRAVYFFLKKRAVSSLKLYRMTHAIMPKMDVKMEKICNIIIVFSDGTKILFIIAINTQQFCKPSHPEARMIISDCACKRGSIASLLPRRLRETGSAPPDHRLALLRSCGNGRCRWGRGTAARFVSSRSHGGL